GLDTVQLSTTPVPVLTNNPAAKTICSGESTQIALTSDLPGANFYWTASLTSGTVTGFTPDSGLVINQTLINTGAAVGVVTYHIMPKIGDCAGIPVDYLVTVNVGNPVGVSIAATGNNICAGTQVTFTATPTNPGNSPVYQWKINAINVINANSAVYTYTPVNGDCVTCQLTSDIVCSIGNPALSNSICMIVDPMLPVSVTVTTPLTAVCAGASVTFTANPTHGGTLPMYQWKVNTLNVSGATNSTFTYVPLNGDIVTCQLTSSDNCVTGNPALSPPVTMTVNQNLEVTVSITASSNPFCAGSQVTFIAVPGHGGLVPGYQWKVNAINMINANNASYAYNAVAGDVVTCEMTSSESCVSGNPALSNAITMSVNTNLPAGVSISTPTNPFCLGTLVTFTATPVNGGSMSAYQWKVNAINVNNAINAGFTYNSLPGDVVSCVMTSNLNCVTGNPVTSAPIVMIERVGPAVSFTACFDTITTVNAKPIKLKGGLPPGGQYSGPGVNTTTGFFNPSEVGTGLKTISYSYTNVYTCGTSKTRTILVQPAPAFICGNNLTDIRDNRVYATVLIGLQCWMKENLDFGFGISDLVPQTDNCVAEKFLRYSIFNIRYSTFYQWDELMRYDPTPASQGLCPPGWHVPTSSEWDQLVLFCNGPGQAGGPMKDSLLVNGFQSHQQGFLYLNNTWAFTSGNTAGTMYWTSTASGAARAVARGLNEYNLSVSRYEAARGNAFSVRCLKD
ncbi:MAG: FISUMP domain-containing protein, partial [Bacteroidota bacterium]